MQINGKMLCDNCFEEIEKEPCPFCGFVKSEYHPVIGVLPVGTVLRERYHIGKVLGEGGFGVTYKAYDTLLKCPVAVKEYYPSGMAHRDTGTTKVSVRDKTLSEDFQSGAEKFCEEAKTLSRFNGNPNIVGVYDYFQENGTAYFIMEYLDGMDLKHYIKLMGGKLTQENVLYIARAVSDALLITHSMNVLHRDISPDNIYITSDGKIKLIDFGAARQVMSQQSKSLSVILKQGFAPLEQYQRKGKQGSWTDIYALGATMYYALTGKIPDDVTERIEEPEIGKAEDYGVDPEFWAVIDKCMAVKISDRYGETFELKHDLNKLKVHEKELERPAPKSGQESAQQEAQPKSGQQAVMPQAQPQAGVQVQPDAQTSQPAGAPQEAASQAPQEAAIPREPDNDKTMAFSAQAVIPQPAQQAVAQESVPQITPQTNMPQTSFEDDGKTLAFSGDAAYAPQAQSFYAQPQTPQGYYQQQLQGYYQQPQGYYPQSQQPQAQNYYYQQGYYTQPQGYDPQSQGYYQQPQSYDPQPQGFYPQQQWYDPQQYQQLQGFSGQMPPAKDKKPKDSYKMPEDDDVWSSFKKAKDDIERVKESGTEENETALNDFMRWISGDKTGNNSSVGARTKADKEKDKDSYKISDDDDAWNEFAKAQEMIEWYKNR